MFPTLCTETLLLKAWDSVKSKNAGGGVDGLNVSDFDADIGKNIRELSEDLKAGQWEPQPYLRIEIPKKENEKRKLGLLTIRDKIVQQGIRLLIEPKCENLFLGNSYGYRPGKGAAKAIRRLVNERTRKGFDWALKLDIDDFFDNVDHGILQARLKAIVTDAEIVRLVMLCVKMGVVSKSMKWQDTVKGLPQGAVLSPLLANLYLHSFDQFVTARTHAYVRYADDFVILAAQLNPYDSVIHVRQHGKPTFAFDFIEIFRAQAVDRVVISLIQKNEPLEIKDGRLSEATRKLLVKNITERLYKRETFRKESMTLDRIIKVQAREIAQYFTENKKFKPYKAKW